MREFAAALAASPFFARTITAAGAAGAPEGATANASCAGSRRARVRNVAASRRQGA
jgi:hypothetical protein